jgi:DNA polymerase-3 subunit chi
MTQVDFYVPAANQSLLQTAFRLIETARSRNLSVHVHTQNTAQAEALSSALWTQRDDSFLVHDHDAPDAIAPLRIGQSEPRWESQVLLNLSSEVPLFFARHERLLEFVDPEQPDPARERFRFYRDRGYAPNTHKL